MAATRTIKHPERRAFAISVAAHIFLFLLLLAFAGTEEKIMRVSIVVETERPERVQIEEEKEEITSERESRPKIKSVEKKRQKNAQKTSAGSRQQPGAPEDQWSRYERQMHSRNSNSQHTAQAAGNSGPKWGSEKTGRSSKRGEKENVAIPKGDSKTSTRWRKGAARRLLTMPTIEYPESVRKKSGQGQVELQIEVNAQGRVEEIEIIKSSGYTRLDINARNAYRSAVFSPSPSGESATGIVIVTFRMRDN